MADTEMLSAEGEAFLGELINKRIGGVWLCLSALLSSTLAGTGIELEVLFDAALNGGRLDWKDVMPRIEGRGPLLLVAYTDKGYVVLSMREESDTDTCSNVFGGFSVLPFERNAGFRNDIQSFLFRLKAQDTFSPLVCEAKPQMPDHVCLWRVRHVNVHDRQVNGDDHYGLYFGLSDLSFWRFRSFALGQETNGSTHAGSSFVQPSEGPYALNNGEQKGFVFTAFQVLLVRPTDGLCSQEFWSRHHRIDSFCSDSS
jgi:hypothetical protein